MKKRLTQPKNNKYYIRTVTGGLNGAVAGSPTIKGANVLCNCVGYANGRFNEAINDPNLMGTVIKFHYQLTCNAENFIESAKRQGLKISSKPVTGGVMVWQKGRTLGGGDGAGHVAFVEAVYDDGTILTSESGWASWAFKTVRRSNNNGRWGQASAYKFRGCIINPTVDLTVEKAPKLVVDGKGGACTVRAMQRFFGTIQDGVISGQKKADNKYYPALTAVEYGKGGSACIKKLQKWVSTSQDGVLGEKTVKAWQKKLGVSSDGVFGANSMRAWQEYLNTHDKAVYPIEPEAEKPTPQDKMCEWAKKIASDNSYHYVKYSLGKKAHECPICHDHPKGTYHGWNCIGYAFASWKHGAGIKCRCSCDAMTDPLYEKVLNASKANALKIVQERIKVSTIKVMKNKSGLDYSTLKKGDIVVFFKGSKYVHTALWVGDGKIADCTSGRKDNIKYGVKPYAKWKIKIAIRYTGK